MDGVSLGLNRGGWTRRCAAVVLVGLAIGALAPDRVAGQNTTPASLQRRDALAAEKRSELQAQLRQYATILEAQSNVVRIVAKLVGPSVVHVSADTAPRRAVQMGRGRPHAEEAGSGVIVEYNKRLYVLTNRHVIREATPEGIKIQLDDGRQITPQRVWDDIETDVAVLAVTATDLVAAPVGDSDKVGIGDFVLAFGSPFGLTQSVTFGIISAKGRRDLKLDDSGLRLQDFLQTDAAINPGNSGGPLINLKGEVIGINTAIASNSGGSEGIGFSIPINMFMTVARQLIEKGAVTRAFLGVSLEVNFQAAMADELGLPRPTGALVTAVTAKSPADLAKLQVRDVVLEFNNVPVENEGHLINIVSLTDVGKKVPLVVWRDRAVVRLAVEVGDRAKFLPPQTEPQ